MARCIRPMHKLTVISASLQVSEILGSNEAIEVVQLGGSLRHSSLSTVGKYAEAPLSDLSSSKLCRGVDGIDLDFGITTTEIREADLNKVMMRSAQKTIVLADSSKFRRRGFSKIANMDEVDLIITDSRISDKLAQRIEELGIELVVVPDESHDMRATAMVKIDSLDAAHASIVAPVVTTSSTSSRCSPSSSDGCVVR